MRRLLAIFTALAVVLALATPASAKKPIKPGPPPDPPTETPVCAEVLPEFTGGELLCAWTVELGKKWNITVVPNTVARKVTITVRDADPGNMCAYVYAPGRSTLPVTTGDFDLPNGQCGSDGDPEFFVLVNAGVSTGNSVAVTVNEVG